MWCNNYNVDRCMYSSLHTMGSTCQLMYKYMYMYYSFLHFNSLYLQQAMPSSLPKVLNAVKWNHHKDVAVVSDSVHFLYCFSFILYRVWTPI